MNDKICVSLQTRLSEGLSKKFLTHYFTTQQQRMIDKNFVKNLVEQWLEGKEYFLTDLTISADDRIVVEIDHEEGVWIEDCVELSRFIESHLDREEEDFELEVGSAGIGQPFKVLKQYEIHQVNASKCSLQRGKNYKEHLAMLHPKASHSPSKRK